MNMDCKKLTLRGMRTDGIAEEIRRELERIAKLLETAQPQAVADLAAKQEQSIEVQKAEHAALHAQYVQLCLDVATVREALAVYMKGGRDGGSDENNA